METGDKMMRGHECKILVVDDSPTNRMILVRALRKANYHTVEAEDGFTAQKLADAERPDLILLDVMMPGLDGFEVCAWLKAHDATADIPIIFLTAKTETEDVERAFSVGGCDYVTKPFRISEVKARMSVHLELRQAQRELLRRNQQLEDMSRIIAETNCELAKQARTDTLCGVLNRGAWEEAITAEHSRFSRTGRKYCVVMIDVDQFKLFNDTLGHQAGDECLRMVAQGMQASCRGSDVIGRYGGEEFVILAPETDMATALSLAERVRRGLVSLKISHPASSVSTHVTASFGVAEVEGGRWEGVLTRADEALYCAKMQGRNKVCAASDDDGATVRFSPQPESSCGVGSAPGDTEAFRVLIIDDNERTRLLCKETLQSRGHQVTLVGDGEGALTKGCSPTPDLIIMRDALSDMDAVECLRKLKQKPAMRNTQIIVISGDIGADRLDQLVSAGADEFLSEPIRPTKLLLRVDGILKLQSERRNLLESYELRGEQTRILALLLDLCGMLGSAVDVGKVLDESVSAASALTSCRRVSIMLPGEDSSTLRIVHSIGMDEAEAKSVRVPIGEPVEGGVFLTGKRFVLDASGVASGGAESRPAAATPLVSMPLLCSSVGMGQRVIGVLSLADRLGQSGFASHELESIELLCKIVGTAIYAFEVRQSREDARDSVLVAISGIARRHGCESGAHLDRVTAYAMLIANELRKDEALAPAIDDSFLRNLSRAVPIHDIGKIAIPDQVLLKPGALTREERDLMRSHAKVGAQAIGDARQHDPGHEVLAMAEEIALAHHEWYDGTGYPDGLVADAIPVSARIVMLAVAYDAITTQRPYKKPATHDQAITIILKQSGTQFDPAVVEAFLRCESDFNQLLTRSTPSDAESVQTRSKATASGR